jgi:4-amino-4-deoxy-L-arabinose transferase-like glycosyltransferase
MAIPMSSTSVAENLCSGRDDGVRPPLDKTVLTALAVVVLMFVALVTFVAVKTPAWESADEPGHFENIETLVRGHWYGMALPCTNIIHVRDLPQIPAGTPLCLGQGNEAEQPPLYYLLMAGWQDLLALPAHNTPKLIGTFVSNGELFTNHPDRGFLLWLRYPNVLLGAATVVMTFFAAREVSRDRWTPIFASAIVAFVPRFVFLSAFVTNDNLVDLLGAILTFCALRFIRRANLRWIAAVGAVFGLLVTTKLSVLPLGLLLPALALSTPTTWLRRLYLLSCGLGTAVVVSAWYLIQNWVRYGDPVAGHVSSRYESIVGGLGTPLGTPYVVTDPFRLVFFDVPRRFIATYWFESGWMTFHWPMWVGMVITLTVILVMFGLMGQHMPKRELLTVGMIAVLSLACVWFVAFQTATYQFRLALVGLPATGVLLSLSLRRWPVQLRWLFPIAGLVGCLLSIRLYILDIHWT